MIRLSARLLITGGIILYLQAPSLLWSQSVPALLTGIVTNAVNNNPVIGAKITVGNQSTYSVSGGIYSLAVDPVGTYPVICIKTGFDTYTSQPVTFQQGVVTTHNIALWENPNPPGIATAVLDAAIPSVHIAWQLPAGPCEVLYDDGIPDNFTVWATQGNMNAVKFTPVGYPAKITGGSIHIGTLSNYQPGSNPLVPFQVSVYNAGGPGGTPGNLLAGPVDVIPTSLEWINFTIPSPPTVNSGSFFIVMIQGGNAPNAAGLSVDETFPQFRSYFRFVTGSGPWIPAGGNFMIRAVVNSPGGPSLLAENPGSLLGYQVWRLKQGEEMNPAVWTSIGILPGSSINDNSWPSLPCSPYRWGIKAQYSGNRWSPVTFSNVIGKCWTVPVTVHVEISCASANAAGTRVQLKNLVYTDTLYASELDTSGTALFPNVWKGTYQLRVTRFGYQALTKNISVSFDTTLNVTLLQEKTPPQNLVVNDKSLLATWNKPRLAMEIFHENWESGNFVANGWITQGGINWIVSLVSGNPSPSAMFNWTPQRLNYEQSLISRTISGEDSPVLTLNYDIYLDSFGTTTINQMAVELWDGTEWQLLKHYDNLGGDIPWTSEEVDISAYTDLTFRIRFRAYGGDTYDINNWNIDNISIVASENQAIIDSCIIGYNFYVNTVLCGFVDDTSFTIPGGIVQYGNAYEACVLAVYGSGFSPAACENFVSHYLVPPTNLTGTGIEDAAYLTWNKPQALKNKDKGTGTPPGLTGYTIFRDGNLRDSILYPDTLFYYDYGLDPGTYTYGVTARYDLTPYGFPGQFDESFPAGPETVYIDYGRPLPFFEPWDQGTFTYNDWQFDPAPGNWNINTASGNPAPGAEFSWEPLKINYSYALVSPVLDAGDVHCSSVWLDFHYRLKDHNATSTEKLSVDFYYNNAWHELTEYQNSGDIDWTFQHLDISNVKGKAFRVRFRAYGVNSLDILHWGVDNIHVYAVCNPARNLSGEAVGYDVQLSWSPPECGGGFPLNEGFEELQFPPPNWTLVITDTLSTWIHSGTSSPWGVHSGNYAAGVMWNYNAQDEWLIAGDLLVTGDLTFWSYAFQGSVHQDHYYVKVSEDQGLTWTIVFDLSALPFYPGPNGYNQWNEPYVINLDAFIGQVVDIAWQAVDGDNLGLWYAWAIDDCMIGSKKIFPLCQNRSIPGYDVYRQDFGYGPYNKINPDLVTDTTYTDPSLPAGEYSYFVKAFPDECNFVTPSDTILIDVITGIQNNDPGRLTIYPNPARFILNIVSADQIKKVELMDFIGQAVYRNQFIESSRMQLNVSNLQPGVYFVRVTTVTNIQTVKITISR